MARAPELGTGSSKQLFSFHRTYHVSPQCQSASESTPNATTLLRDAITRSVAVHRCSTVALPRSSRASTDTTGRPLVFQATVPGLCPLRAA